MSVTLTYDTTLSRVRIDATDLAAASYATVERSIDQIQWSYVRGGVEATVTAGTMTTVDDYEFAPNVVNYYRVRGVVTDAPTFVAAGVADSGSSGSRTPAAPAGIIDGDLVVILASTRNSGTGTVDTPTDWEQLAESGNVALLGRIYDGVWSMPTITFTGGVANADTLAQAAAFRGVHLEPAVSPVEQLNASDQDIAYPATSITDDDCTVILAGWKQDDWTSVAELAGAVEIGETSSTAGDDAAQVWDYILQTTAANIAAGAFVVTGGASAISRGLVVVLPRQPYLNEQTNSTTPAMIAPWLKSTMRAFLNQEVELGGGPLAPTRVGRGGVHDVSGRTLPIAVTEMGGGRRFDIRLRTTTAAAGQTMDYVLASGDVLFLHGPDTPGVYLKVSQATEIPLRAGHEVRHWLINAREVAAPGPDVVTATATWDTILALYATWDDLLAAHPTWDSVLALLGDPSEVVVP